MPQLLKYSLEAFQTLLLCVILCPQIGQCTPPPPTDSITKDGEIIAVGKNGRFYFLPNFRVAQDEELVVLSGDIILHSRGVYGVTDELRLSKSKVVYTGEKKNIDLRLQWKISNMEKVRRAEWLEIQSRRPWANYSRGEPSYRYSYHSITIYIYVNGKLCLRGSASPPYQELDQSGNLVLLTTEEIFHRALHDLENGGLSVSSDASFLVDELRELNGHLILEGEVFISSVYGMALMPCLHLKPLPESPFKWQTFQLTDSAIDNIVALARQQDLLPRFFKKHFDFEAVTWQELNTHGLVENAVDQKSGR